MSKNTKMQILPWMLVAMPVVHYLIALRLFALAGAGRLHTSMALTFWPFIAIGFCTLVGVWIARPDCQCPRKWCYVGVAMVEFAVLVCAKPFVMEPRDRFSSAMMQRMNAAELALFHDAARDDVMHEKGDFHDKTIRGNRIDPWIKTMNYGPYNVFASKHGSEWSVRVFWGGPTWRWGVSAASDPMLLGEGGTNQVWTWLR